ncbi:hypothetical protein DMB65_09600 [Flavobacterium cheongpyeongense]|uniref:Uncharacterized protein n=1 Tax=Flavobacterium cheongpyeongense TaxID=2212651 RepID=A0A2V4BQA5_9FLAO|nr:hypothetical protein [Flavobacterium cheongpyeongense]PXY41198.1 hypothetical protein DMB65_09600 [Flavobacterium cheongpyeongense]
MEETKVKHKTDYLFSKCTFWRGIGSVFNVPGNYYEFHISETELEADHKALTSDWENIGEDIREAKKKFETLNHTKLCLK